MRKFLLPLVLLAGMTLVGCGGSDPTPEPTPEEGYGVSITNKTQLQETWYAGEASRDLAITLTPAGNAAQEFAKKTLTISSSNQAVVKNQGLALHALAEGTATVTVAYHGWKDTLALTISKMPTVQEKYGVTHSGTSADPLTNEEALTVAKHADYQKYKDDLYVGGKVASFYHAPGSRSDGYVSWFLEPAQSGGEQFEIYKCLKEGTGVASHLTDDDIWKGGYAVAHGKFTVYTTGQCETDTAIFDRCEGEKPAPRQTISATFAETLSAGLALADGDDSYNYYKFQGFVSSKDDKNYYMTAEKGAEVSKENSIELYNVSDTALQGKLLKNAKVEVTMVIKNYHSQVENAFTLSSSDVTVIEAGEEWPTPVPPTPSGWEKITSQPVVGGEYKLILNRENASSNPGLWFLKDQVESETKSDGKAYYIMTSQAEADAAAITLIAVEDGFKVKIGARYLFIGIVGTYTNSLLKDTEAEATVLTYDLTNGFGVVLSEKFWGLGTRNDKAFTTVGAVNFTEYPNNFKACLYAKGSTPTPVVNSLKITKSNSGIGTETLTEAKQVTYAVGEGSLVLEWSAGCFDYGNYDEIGVGKNNGYVKLVSLPAGKTVDHLELDFYQYENAKVFASADGSGSEVVGTAGTPSGLNKGVMKNFAISGAAFYIGNATTFNQAFYSITIVLADANA